jgi:hypothetical protein
MTTQTNDTAKKAKPARAKKPARGIRTELSPICDTLDADAAKAKAARAAKAPAKPAGKAKGAAAAKPAAKPAPAKAERADGLRPGSKMAVAVDMVCRKAGATCPEIAEKLGWTVLNSSTLKRFCVTAKVKLKADENEKPTRFFGTARA